METSTDKDLKMDRTKEYKVFISYSWTNSEHKKWVHNLAERLMQDGINVKYDGWDLKPGHDKYKFMESMIKDDTIDKVLIICDSGYKEKADAREGGVGTETLILTPELYADADQTKFIPVIVEQGDAFDSYMPIFIKSRIGIDMSSAEVYEQNYEQLLRDIVDQPRDRRPRIGSLPSYLFQDKKTTNKTETIINSLKSCIIQNPTQANFFISDFIEEFKIILNEFSIAYEDMKEPYDEIIIDNIHDMMPLRNDYINFLSLVLKSKIDFDIDCIVNLFEKLYPYTQMNGNGTSIEYQFDHYKFFITELFLYTVIILLENKRYEDLNILIGSKYFSQRRFMVEDKPHNFVEFRFYIKVLEEYRKRRIQSRLYSLTADLLVQRSKFDGKNYEQKLLDADLLLFYLSSLKFDERQNNWYPSTYVYGEERAKVEFLQRLISKRHFEQTKVLFSVSSKEELKQLICSKFDDYKPIAHTGSFHSLRSLKWHINPDEICTFV